MVIQITYRKTKRLSMRIVKNCDVHISAPIGISKIEIERFIAEHSDWIDKARQKTSERLTQRENFFNQLPLNTKEEVDKAVLRLKSVVEPLVEKHSQLIGKRPTSVGYKKMTSRWGVCYVKKRSICFSLYLLLLPEWCIEYVVVHELCHLIEPSHNEHFYALMDDFFYHWREARKTIRQITSNK